MAKSTIPEEKALMKKNMLKAMEKAVLMVEADSKLNCPVDTGHLKRSITHDVVEENNSIVGYIGSPVEYAYWAEKRTPYLEPSIDKNIAQIRKMFKDELGKR